MEAKVRVYGKSQSRTALGIVNAYLKLHPDSTLSDLQQAFPQSLNSKSPTDSIIVPEKETQGHEKLFFEREDEMIVLKNGTKLALVEVWTKDDYNAICEHAKQYGIEVAKLEGTKPFERGSYELEYLNDFVPPVGIAEIPESVGRKKRKFRWWWWLLLLIVLLLIVLFCCKKCCCNKECKQPIAPIENITPEISAAVDIVQEAPASLLNETDNAVSMTLPNGSEWKIDKNSAEYKLFTFLNSDEAVDSDKTKGWLTLDQLHFETGKSKLLPESENQLKNVAAILEFFPNSHIKMGGYTDNTGTDAVNMRVSAERAKMAAEKLVSFGIDTHRVTHEGYGSQHPVCPKNDTDECRSANRRVDIRVSQK